MSKHSKVGFELAGYESSSVAGNNNGTAVNKIITPENVGTEVRHDMILYNRIKCYTAQEDRKQQTARFFNYSSV